MKKAASDEKLKYWQEVINDWQESKLTQQVFCKEYQIKFNQFKNWRYKLNNSIQSKNLNDFIPITVAHEQASQENTLNSVIELHLSGGKKLILRGDYAKTVFDKLVAILHV